MEFDDIKLETEIESLAENSSSQANERTHTKSSSSKSIFFCTLCLRKCAPDSLLEFSPEMDVEAAEQTVSQALGLQLVLENRNMCYTCWKLIELIADFKECCAKAVDKLEKFPAGLVDSDAWTSEDTQNGIDQIRKLMWDHDTVVDTLQERGGDESLTHDIEFEETSFFPDVLVDDSEDYDFSELITVHKDPKRKVTKRNASSTISEEQAQNEPTETSAEKSAESKPLELEVDHYQATIVTCDICNRNFDGKRALRLHKMHCTPTNPSTKKYLCCPICTVSFMDNYSLKFHLNKHKGIRPFKCRKYCDRTYASNFTRMKHERKYCEQEGRICSVCGASLKNEASLELHMQASHGEAKYACEICGRRFKSANICYDHRKVHSDERNYACPMCDKRYKSAFALSVHKRLHDVERPYNCHLCEQGFNYKVLLKNHIERHHGTNDI